MHILKFSNQSVVIYNQYMPIKTKRKGRNKQGRKGGVAGSGEQERLRRKELAREQRQ